MTLTLKDPSLLVSQCYIDGAFVGEGVDPVIDPATGEELARVPRFAVAEAKAAVEAAARAFRPWGALTAKERSKILRRWYDLIVANREDLATILTAEQGKPWAEALGEIDYGAAYVEFYAEEAKRIRGETLPSHRADGRILVLRQPVGVVAAITPWKIGRAHV